jgi:hypothetical protein
MASGRAWRTSAAIAIAATNLGGAGCAVFTDLDVGPYALADASNGDSGACEAGKCPGLALDCRSSLDCDGGGVCCLTPVSGNSAAFTCQPKVCPTLPSLQLCKTDAECSGSSCLQQGCPVNGLVVKVGGCGLLLGCSAL